MCTYAHMIRCKRLNELVGNDCISRVETEGFCLIWVLQGSVSLHDAKSVFARTKMPPSVNKMQLQYSTHPAHGHCWLLININMYFFKHLTFQHC